MDPEIIYEDADIVAINKPAGLVVHSDGRTEEPSVAEWFAETYPEARNVGEPIEREGGEPILRPGIVHRLDRETSGVLVLARSAKGFEHLKKQFQDREIEKVYHAFVYGHMKDDHGSINLPIARSSGDFRKRTAGARTRGESREALTYYQVIDRTGEGMERSTFVEARPKTGRTHQIRVHFKALGHPVVADPLYAAGKEKLLGFERLALHARRLSFADLAGIQHTVEAGYPEDFSRAVLSLHGRGTMLD